MCHGLLACGTLHTAPTLPVLTVLEETLKAALVACIQTLTPCSVPPSVIFSLLHFCSLILPLTGSHMSLHFQFFPWSSFLFMLRVTCLLCPHSSLLSETISCISLMNAIHSSAWNCLSVGWTARLSSWFLALTLLGLLPSASVDQPPFPECRL